MKDKNMVSQSHFNMPEINMASNLETPSLPASYGETSIFLMTVDPYSAHLIWEVDADDMTRLNQKEYRPVIKLHDISRSLSYATAARTSFEVKINIDDKKSYITLPKAGRTYSAELGFKNAAGHFFSLAQSNSAEAPRDTPTTEFSPNNESANDASVTSKTAAPARRLPLENRGPFDAETVNTINAIEIINNPPPGIPFLPHIEAPCFTSLDYSRLHKNLPRKTSQHEPNADLTAFCEKRFISGISSR